MKRFLMAAIAVLMMASTAVAAEKPVIIENNVTAATAEENILDKFIALVKSHIQKINATKDIDELVEICMKAADEITVFEEKHAEEIMAFGSQLTEEQKKAYDEQFNKALAELEAASDRKSKEFLGDYEDIDF